MSQQKPATGTAALSKEEAARIEELASQLMAIADVLEADPVKRTTALGIAFGALGASYDLKKADLNELVNHYYDKMSNFLDKSEDASKPPPSPAKKSQLN
jgi:hypothetical protein